MIATESDRLPADVRPPLRTIWGHTPHGLHECFWASRRIQVVRQGQSAQPLEPADYYLLVDEATLAVFDLARVARRLSPVRTELLCVRLHHRRNGGYREHIVTDDAGRFLRFERTYSSAISHLRRVGLTRDPRIAAIWQFAPDVRTGWRKLRQVIPDDRRASVSSDGNVYDKTVPLELAAFVRELTRRWTRPDAAMPRAERAGGEAWKDPTANVDARARLIGQVWIGAGRTISADTTVIGPTIVWDDPAARPQPRATPIASASPDDLHQPDLSRQRDADHRRAYAILKRLFDLAFSAAALIFTLPLYPIIMLAIWIEDGRPFFFAHRRETRGGKEFPCIKFRSMRRDAEKIKQELAHKNQADGPQFFIENDPRRTRVGSFLRKYRIDELPQFINVLLGHMSVVGPRPSPYKENQFCPPWREARLSVRPGITGLWQVRRTRQSGNDFQEWIRYDVEYVKRADFLLDLRIVFETVRMMVLGVFDKSAG